MTKKAKMLYLILMNPNENQNSMYKGAICIMNGKPWYVTSLAKPTIYTSDKEAHKVMFKLMKEYGDNEFMTVTVDSYLTLIGESLNKWSNSWISLILLPDR